MEANIILNGASNLALNPVPHKFGEHIQDFLTSVLQLKFV